jgi:Protein of unknown function (DUF2971)
MKYPEIQTLYKYMSWNDFTKESIEQGSFWFSSPTRFNDPIDCGISLNTIGNTPLLTNLIASGFTEIGKATGVAIKNPSQSKSITESIQQFASSFINNTEALSSEMSEARLDQAAGIHLKEKFASAGILSLSELGDNILMWSHYAQQHKGICIEFRRNPSNILGKPDHTSPVRYSIKAPTIDARNYRTADKEGQNEIELSLVLTKAADWTYEREWRVVKNGCANSTQPLECKIESITLGLRSENAAQEHILSLAKREGFKVNKANLKPNEFGLKIEQLY